MNAETAKAVAEADSANIKNTSIGYAVNFVMDYGNGRQVTISGTLPLGASLATMNAELDKLRLATNRQSALVIKRDLEAKLIRSKKMVAALDLMISSYEDEMQKQINALSERPDSKHTVSKQQVANIQAQVSNYKAQKMEEKQRAQGDVEICEVTIASIDKELATIEG